MSVLSAIPGVSQARAAWAAGKAWFFVGAALAILGMGFYLGHHWAGVATAQQVTKTQAAEAARDSWKAASEGWQLAAQRWEARYKADEKAAAARAAQAGRILSQLNADKTKADQAARAWQARYQQGVTTPDCLAVEKLVAESKCAVFKGY